MIDECFGKLREMGFTRTYENARKHFFMSEILRKTEELKNKKEVTRTDKKISKFSELSPKIESRQKNAEEITDLNPHGGGFLLFQEPKPLRYFFNLKVPARNF